MVVNLFCGGFQGFFCCISVYLRERDYFGVSNQISYMNKHRVK